MQQSAWLRSALAEREAQFEELQDQHLRLVVSNFNVYSIDSDHTEFAIGIVWHAYSIWCICLVNRCTVNGFCVMQQRSQEARQNWESALESKDRALTQLEDALVTQKRTLQQQMDQQQAAVSMTHNQLIQGTDAQIAMQRQLEQSQQQVCSSICLYFVRSLCYPWHNINLASHVMTFCNRDT